jgi:LPS export ABC transporter protein LptC/lipopolysaccharide transport protein LptA
MAHWAQRARWIVAFVGVTFAVVVFFALRQRARPTETGVVTPSDPGAEVEITGATSSRWSGANENFTVKAERQLSYPDGRLKLEGVTVYVDDRDGRRKFVATGDEGEAGPKQEFVNLKRNVTLVSSDGLKVGTAEASYASGEGIVRAPGPVTFSRGRMTGRGIGMTYDRNRDVLWILDQAEISMAPDEKGAGQLAATAGKAGLARREKYLRFEQDVRIHRDNRRIQADTTVGYLSDDESRLTGLELRGRSSIDTEAAPAGTLRSMRARDINVKYSEDGERIEHALLAGGGSIEIAGEGQKPGRRVAGELLDIGLNADGTTVTSLVGRQNVRLDFPADGTVPARSVTALALDGAAGSDGTLTGARLTDNVEYRELVGTPPVPRIVRARALDLKFTSGMAGITDARFTGNVRLEEGDLRATAATATYRVDRGVIDLAGDSTAPPNVTDARMRVDARGIVLTVDGPKIVAKQDVRSELRPDSRGSGPESAGGRAGAARGQTPPPQAAGGAKAADQMRVPGFLAEDQPVNVTADALDYDGATSRAVYTGKSRLWQGESVVQGDRITVDSKSGNLKAEGSVRSTLMLQQTDTETKEVKKVATIATARVLDYDDQARRATYTTDARLNGPQGDLVARKIELYLGMNDSELERVEGYEAVTLRDAGRTATGDRLSYLAADEQYDMTGIPVRIVEECRETTGRTLTFYKAVDRILVDGQQITRTRTKSGGNCPDSGRSNAPAPAR